MRGKKPSRRERQKAAYYKEILDAAHELFTTNGYHNVTMHQIAERAEFSIGTLYNFFKNKEDLYHSLILEKYKEFAEPQFSTLDKDLPVMQRIREFVEYAIRFFEENTAFIRIFLSESRGESFNLRSALRKDARKITVDLDNRLASVMEEGVRGKIFRKLSPVHLALNLQGICQAFLFQAMDRPEQFPNGVKTDVILDLFTRGAAAGPGSLNQATDSE